MTITNTIVFFFFFEAIHEKTDKGERRYRYITNQASSRSSKTSSLIDCFDLYCRAFSNKRLTAWR